MKNFNDVISGVDEVINNAKQGNFDDVLAKTKSYAEKATKRSAERLEISRKKIDLLDSKTKLAKAYEKYGRLVYERDNGGEIDEEKLASYAAEIQLQKMRSDMLDDEIQELKDLFSEPRAKKEREKEPADAEVEVTVVEPDDE